MRKFFLQSPAMLISLHSMIDFAFVGLFRRLSVDEDAHMPARGSNVSPDSLQLILGFHDAHQS